MDFLKRNLNPTYPTASLTQRTALITFEERYSMCENDDERLFLAVIKNKEELARELLERGANPNTFHGINKTPLLHLALLTGNKSLVKLLLDFKADPNATDQHGMTIMHEVVAKKIHDAKDWITLFVKYAADIHQKTKKDKHIFDIAREMYGHNVQKKIATHLLKIATKFKGQASLGIMPAQPEYSCFSLQVYRGENCPAVPVGWSILADCPPEYSCSGYFASAFVGCYNPDASPEQQMFYVVIAHRGAIPNPEDTLQDYLTHLAESDSIFQNNSRPFVQYVIKKFEEMYPKAASVCIVQTGHSLGAIFAELNFADLAPTQESFIYTFDCPGSLEIMQDLVASGKLTAEGLSTARIEAGGEWCEINAFNTCKTQVFQYASPGWWSTDEEGIVFDQAPTNVSENDYFSRFSKIVHDMNLIYKRWHRSKQSSMVDTDSWWPIPAKGFEGGYECYITYYWSNKSKDRNKAWATSQLLYWEKYIQAYWDTHPEIHDQYANDEENFKNDFVKKNLKTRYPDTANSDKLSVSALMAQSIFSREIETKTTPVEIISTRNGRV